MSVQLSHFSNFFFLLYNNLYSGDGRVNEQIDLALVHTIWLREHNRVAFELSRLNPRWSDEAIFQETRRIVIAQVQHITYNEFLPIILGRHTRYCHPRSNGINNYKSVYRQNLYGQIRIVADRERMVEKIRSRIKRRDHQRLRGRRVSFRPHSHPRKYPVSSISERKD